MSLWFLLVLLFLDSFLLVQAEDVHRILWIMRSPAYLVDFADCGFFDMPRVREDQVGRKCNYFISEGGMFSAILLWLAVVGPS